MLSLLLPERCVHCEHPTARATSTRATRRGNVETNEHALASYLCAVCLRVLERTEPPDSRKLQERLGRTAPGVTIEHCAAAYEFSEESPVRSIIHSFKYAGMPRLAREIGTLLRPLLPSGSDAVIPVPLHRTRFAERGYNQADMLSRGLSRELNHPKLVRRTRPTPSQTTLSLEERLANVQDAFALSSRASTGALKGKCVVLVDDVMTTGATLLAVAEAIQPSQPRSISILTFAAAPGIY